jgi:hypothetical protein
MQCQEQHTVIVKNVVHYIYNMMNRIPLLNNESLLLQFFVPVFILGSVYV